MSVETATGKHLPADPSRFEFDGEVASVFDNMAQRSIPGYSICHDMVARLADKILHPGAIILDVGCSTGNAFMAAENRAPGKFQYVGVDLSEPMLDRTIAKCPSVTTRKIDLREAPTRRDGGFQSLCRGGPSVILFGWTLQFIKHRSRRDELIYMAYEALAPGGFIVVMEKYSLGIQEIEDCAQEAYMQFRLDNGYTQFEIDAKTKALKNSMWPTTPTIARSVLFCAGFNRIDILYRLYNFGAFVAFKDA